MLPRDASRVGLMMDADPVGRRDPGEEAPGRSSRDTT